MSVHSSLRRRALALPVALVVALGAAGVVAGPAYADTTEPPASAPVDPTAAPAADPNLDGAVDSDAAADAPAADAAPDAADPAAAAPAPEAAPAPAPAPALAPAPAAEAPLAPEAAPAPGDAAALPFTVLVPQPGSTSLNRTVLFAGSGTDGSIVTVTAADGSPLPGSTPIPVTGGAWTATVTFADDAATDQTVVITQTTAGAANGSETVSFVLPAPGVVVPFEIVTPAEGESQPTRTVVVSGTGTEGSVITVAGSDGQPLAAPTVVTAGLWVAPVTFADDAPTTQTITVTQTTPEGANEDATVSFQLPPAPALPAPVITSPAEGETVTGTQVTFRGTGQPGAFIGLVVLPSALVTEPTEGAPTAPAAGDEPAMAAAAAPAAAPAPANPADPIPVGADGTWTVTLALTAEDYTAVAIQSADAAGATGLSDPSARVSFSLRAPAPVAVPAVAASGPAPRVLAATGGEDVTGLFGIGILVMLAGATAVVTSNRRRAMS